MCPFTEIKVSFDDNGGDNYFKNNSPPPPVVLCPSVSQCVPVCPLARHVNVSDLVAQQAENRTGLISDKYPPSASPLSRDVTRGTGCQLCSLVSVCWSFFL